MNPRTFESSQGYIKEFIMFMHQKSSDRGALLRARPIASFLSLYLNIQRDFQKEEKLQAKAIFQFVFKINFQFN